MENLKICNISMSGSINLGRKLSQIEIQSLMQKGWNLSNESKCPVLIKKEEGGVCAILNLNGSILIQSGKNKKNGINLFIELQNILNQ